jgi:uncharacterized membrane protein
MTTLAVVGSDLYKWLLAVHILAAVLWIGSAFLIQVLMIRATRANAPEQTAYLAGEAEWYGQRFLIPFSLLLVIIGFLLIHESDGAWDLGQTWLSIGLGVWIASFLTGAGFLGPESGRIGKLFEEKGAADPEYQRRLARIFLVSRIELVLLIIVVLDMAIKPWL